MSCEKHNMLLKNPNGMICDSSCDSNQDKLVTFKESLDSFNATLVLETIGIKTYKGNYDSKTVKALKKINTTPEQVDNVINLGILISLAVSKLNKRKLK